MMSARSEYYTLIDNDLRRRILRGLLQNFYEDLRPPVVAFDTNRQWTMLLPALHELVPDVKVVCCVRSPDEIFASLERLAQKSPLEQTRIFEFEGRLNVYRRAEALTSHTGLIGASLAGLKEAFFGPFSESLLLVEYDSLVRDPKQVLDSIYEFCGLPAFDHDFADIRFDARDFDLRLGAPGLHQVAGPVRVIERESILPLDLQKSLRQTAFWRHPLSNPRNVRVI